MGNGMNDIDARDFGAAEQLSRRKFLRAGSAGLAGCAVVVAGCQQSPDGASTTASKRSFTGQDAGAATAVGTVATALGTLGTAQATVGTLQNRLQFAMNLAQTQIVNVKAAESRIRDANIAEESANLTRFNILTQSGIAALAQANSSSGAVLALLR